MKEKSAVTMMQGRTGIVWLTSYVSNPGYTVYNYFAIVVCHESDFCKTEGGNNRKLYREVFVPGVLSCFFGQYLQDSPNLVSLITRADYMPIQVAPLDSNLDCVHS